MYLSDPPIGAKVSRQSVGPTRHFGVPVGYDEHGTKYFAHNSPVCGGVCLVSAREFSQGKPLRIESVPAPGTEGAIVSRALAMQGQRYDLVCFNCETYANFVTEGRAYSGQVRVVAVGAGIVLGAIGLYYMNRAASYDRNVGRFRDRRGRFKR